MLLQDASFQEPLLLLSPTVANSAIQHLHQKMTQWCGINEA
jgi:hypothetical protein